jgi:hypothetical protein
MAIIRLNNKYSFLLIIIFSLFVSTSAFATTYYVDASRPNDLGDGLSKATAWKTIGKVNSMRFANNDTIKFKREQTWTDSSLTLDRTSKGISGITIEDYGSGKKPRIDGNFVRPIIINHALVNLTIRNLDISGSDTLYNRCQIQTVKGLTIDGLDYNGHTGSSTYRRSNAITINNVEGAIEIKNCTIKNLMKSTFADTSSAWGKKDAIAILFWYPDPNQKISGSVSIHDNTIENTWSDSVQLAGVQVTSLIYNNNFSRFHEEAIDLKSTAYTKIYSNEIHYSDIGRLTPTYSGGGGGLVIHNDKNYFGAYTSHDIEIFDNYFHTFDGKAITGGKNIKIYRNHFKDVCQAIRLNSEVGPTNIFDNIFEATASYQCRNYGAYTGKGAFVWFNKATIYNTSISNNTIKVQSSAKGILNSIYIKSEQSATVIERNNFNISNTSSYAIYWTGSGNQPKLNSNNYCGESKSFSDNLSEQNPQYNCFSGTSYPQAPTNLKILN